MRSLVDQVVWLTPGIHLCRTPRDIPRSGQTQSTGQLCGIISCGTIRLTLQSTVPHTQAQQKKRGTPEHRSHGAGAIGSDGGSAAKKKKRKDAGTVAAGQKQKQQVAARPKVNAALSPASLPFIQSGDVERSDEVDPTFS